MGVDNMRSEQGLQACLGMRSPVHVVRVASLQGSNTKPLSQSLLEACHGD
jgi:hypothetical protein